MILGSNGPNLPQLNRLITRFLTLLKYITPGVILVGWYMRIFKIKPFNKWVKKSGLSDINLVNAVDEIERGLIDANLGGNLFKKRVATSSGGKRGGFRTLLAYKVGRDVFFLHGFEKNEKDNITCREERALKDLTEFYLSLTRTDIQIAIAKNELIEVEDE